MAMKPRKKTTQGMRGNSNKAEEEMGGRTRGSGAVKKMRGGGMVKKMRGGGAVKTSCAVRNA